MRKIFPVIENVTKVSTAMCVAVFDELDAALNLLDTARNEFNPLQRQLLGRFIMVAKVFGRDMLAADGNRHALRETFGLSPDDAKTEKSDSQHTTRGLLDDVYTGVCADLERIGASVQDGLLTGVVDMMASIRATEASGVAERDALEAMASSVRHLAQQIAALFEAQPDTLRRYQLVYQADAEAVSNEAPLPSMSVEAFMQSSKPPIRRPTLRERLAPYVPQLLQLRQAGYTYAQCAQFLRSNGINTYAEAISDVLVVASR